VKWAIVFYAIFTYANSPGTEPVEHVSWGITFNHHEQCMQFYEQKKQDIIKGVQNFASSHYGQQMLLQELGCAHASANFDKPDEEPIVTLKMPLHLGDSI